MAKRRGRKANRRKNTRRAGRKAVIARLKSRPKTHTFAWVDKKGNVKASRPHSKRGHKSLGLKIKRKAKTFYYVKGLRVMGFKPRNVK